MLVQPSQPLWKPIQTSKELQPFSLEVKCACCQKVNVVSSVQPAPVDLPSVILARANGPIKIELSQKQNQAVTKQPQNKKDYYAVLGFASPIQTPDIDTSKVSSNDIKKAYHKLALQHHPDKMINSESHEENGDTFKLICEAYSVLGDADKRQQYDRYLKLGGDFSGDQDAAAKAMANPEEFFQSLFGGDRFHDIIGSISIGREFGDAMFESKKELSAQEVKAKESQADEQRLKRRKDRVKTLVSNLLQTLSYYTDHHLHNIEGLKVTPAEEKNLQKTIGEEFIAKVEKEANELKFESYGVEILHAVGYMYSLKGQQFLGKEETFLGIGSMYGNLKERGHFISSTFGTIRAAVSLQSTLNKLQSSEEPVEQSSDVQSKPASKTSPLKLTPEQRQNLEQQAANKGIETLWRGSKMEIQSVVRDVCDSILDPNSVTATPSRENVDPNVHVKELLKRRARGLVLLGKVYESVKKEDGINQ